MPHSTDKRQKPGLLILKYIRINRDFDGLQFT